MPILGSSSPSQSQSSSLRIPASKRICVPASQRLTAITEDPISPLAPPIPPKSHLRNSASSLHCARQSRAPSSGRRWSGSSRSTSKTSRTAPPPYDWVPEPVPGEDDGNAPVEGEKLAQLRRGEGPKRKGGWWRLGVLIGVVLLVIMGLAVGLGVGLTRKKSKDQNGSGQPTSTTPDTTPPQKFPLGEYSMITALKQVQTNCTANSATWRCWPYVVYDSYGTDTNSSSLASFNLVITNTSMTYATDSTLPTSEDGIPSNLTISGNNPFGITFTNQTMTYISSSANSSSPRYTFSFTTTKAVIPSPAITSNNAVAECFFNQTTLSGALYLSAPRNYPVGIGSDSTSTGGYQPWPYAVEISQIAAGGQNVPNCYETVNGAVGDRIVNGLDSEPDSTECICGYRNF